MEYAKYSLWFSYYFHLFGFSAISEHFGRLQKHLIECHRWKLKIIKTLHNCNHLSEILFKKPLTIFLSSTVGDIRITRNILWKPVYSDRRSQSRRSQIASPYATRREYCPHSPQARTNRSQVGWITRALASMTVEARYKRELYCEQ